MHVYLIFEVNVKFGIRFHLRNYSRLRVDDCAKYRGADSEKTKP